VMVTTVPDVTELRRVVRAGRGFSMRIALLVDAASHDERGGAVGDAEAAAAALRVAGWRVTVLRRGDRIDERWRDLLVHRRLAAGTVS
jgi:hypothetical protein